MDGIELADFVKQLDSARSSHEGNSVPVRYSGHLLLPGDDVVIAMTKDGDLEVKISGSRADRDHPMATLVSEHAFLIRRALKRGFIDGTESGEIIGRWHENGDEYAFEPYLTRTSFRDRAPVLNKYRCRIFPLDGYKLGNDFSVQFTSEHTGEKVKAVLETSTEMHIHYDELPKSMFSWMPVGVVWTPSKKSGFPVLVEYAVGKRKRSEIRAAIEAA